MWQIPELHQPVPVSPRPPPSLDVLSQSDPQEEPLLSTSNLNKRQASKDPSLAQDSMLNIRYMNHLNNPQGNQVNGHVEPPAENFNLSQNRLNQRYNQPGEPSHAPVKAQHHSPEK